MHRFKQFGQSVGLLNTNEQLKQEKINSNLALLLMLQYIFLHQKGYRYENVLEVIQIITNKIKNNVNFDKLNPSLWGIYQNLITKINENFDRLIPNLKFKRSKIFDDEKINSFKQFLLNLPDFFNFNFPISKNNNLIFNSFEEAREYYVQKMKNGDSINDELLFLIDPRGPNSTNNLSNVQFEFYFSITAFGTEIDYSFINRNGIEQITTYDFPINRNLNSYMKNLQNTQSKQLSRNEKINKGFYVKTAVGESKNENVYKSIKLNEFNKLLLYEYMVFILFDFSLGKESWNDLNSLLSLHNMSKSTIQKSIRINTPITNIGMIQPGEDIIIDFRGIPEGKLSIEQKRELYEQLKIILKKFYELDDKKRGFWNKLLNFTRRESSVKVSPEESKPESIRYLNQALTELLNKYNLNPGDLLKNFRYEYEAKKRGINIPRTQISNLQLINKQSRNIDKYYNNLESYFMRTDKLIEELQNMNFSTMEKEDFKNKYERFRDDFNKILQKYIQSINELKKIKPSNRELNSKLRESSKYYQKIEDLNRKIDLIESQNKRVLEFQQKQNTRQQRIANLQSKSRVVHQTTSKPILKPTIWSRLTGIKGGKSKKL